MNLEHSHQSIRSAPTDRSIPATPKRSFAKRVVSSSRRLRARIGVGIGLCLGLAALVIVLE